ncbi:MAG: hypothetical protein JST04_05630 [Bdellovibrionales bacterium]|nr:hypothetical protein [Bdellovibrionales bacterium]
MHSKILALVVFALSASAFADCSAVLDSRLFSDANERAEAIKALAQKGYVVGEEKGDIAITLYGQLNIEGFATLLDRNSGFTRDYSAYRSDARTIVSPYNRIVRDEMDNAKNAAEYSVAAAKYRKDQDVQVPAMNAIQAVIYKMPTCKEFLGI